MCFKKTHDYNEYLDMVICNNKIIYILSLHYKAKHSSYHQINNPFPTPKIIISPFFHSFDLSFIFNHVNIDDQSAVKHSPISNIFTPINSKHVKSKPSASILCFVIYIFAIKNSIQTKNNKNISKVNDVTMEL